jgi:hypothetical protein
MWERAGQNTADMVFRTQRRNICVGHPVRGYPVEKSSAGTIYIPHVGPLIGDPETNPCAGGG